MTNLMERKSEDFGNECKLVKQGTESESCPIALSQLYLVTIGIHNLVLFISIKSKLLGCHDQ